jgi:solute carrier family 25 S-adenosylmethionine transporter 26
MSESTQEIPMWVSGGAGALAGLSVDVALFPLDTIKTRLQSPQGFLKAGGFEGVYKGVTAAAGGSMPGAALFFCTYETTKPIFERLLNNGAQAQMVAASVAETMACLVRVPTEVVKQRMQTGMEKSALEAVPKIIKNEGIGGIYAGFGVTVMREIPFSAIQFPIYERLKDMWSDAQGHRVAPWQSAACGSFAGGVAAAVTTPLDVIKTRLMLGADSSGVAYQGAFDVYSKVVKNEGFGTLFSGIQPRVMWISIGGFVFFGAYEGAKSMLMKV